MRTALVYWVDMLCAAWAGGTIGFVTACCMAAAKRADERMEAGQAAALVDDLARHAREREDGVI